MYQVILINDEVRNKNYYYSYVESTDESLGNITVEDLPGFADITKARSCYYKNSTWVFDEDKYAELVSIAEAERERAEEEKAKSLAALSNEEIAEALMELAEMMASIDERLSVLGV